jgi:hypothetical protein
MSLGIDEDQRSQGLVGNLRNFQMLYFGYDDGMVKRLQYA